MLNKKKMVKQTECIKDLLQFTQANTILFSCANERKKMWVKMVATISLAFLSANILYA